jgi:hypothetical protein
MSVRLELFSNSVQETLMEKSGPVSNTVAHSTVTSQSNVGRLRQLHFRDEDPLPAVPAARAEDLSLNELETLDTIRKPSAVFEGRTRLSAMQSKDSCRCSIAPVPGELSVAFRSYLTVPEPRAGPKQG